MRNLRITSIIGLLVVFALGLAACSSDNAPANTGSADLSTPVTEQNLQEARQVFDAGKDRWDSFDPFAHTMTIGFDAMSLLRLEFDAEGNTVSEELVLGEASDSTVTALPRSVEAVFAELDSIIASFESGEYSVPDDGDCAFHFNIRFNADWGVPEYYDTLSPCDDGVGISITIELVETDGKPRLQPDLDEELLLVAEGVAIDDVWPDYANESSLGDEVDLPPVDGFEPFNNAWQLADGRYLVRGQWDEDDPIAGWYQRNPDSVAPGESVPEHTERNERPIRLFVVDVESERIVPISHIPEVRPFNTAVSIGDAADVILDVALLADGETVAYTAGFHGAAYNQAYVLYTAVIPAR